MKVFFNNFYSKHLIYRGNSILVASVKKKRKPQHFQQKKIIFLSNNMTIYPILWTKQKMTIN
jgi:hypothetical protein